MPDRWPGERGFSDTLPDMEITIGYARCSASLQGLEANRWRLRELGIPVERIPLDGAYFATDRARPAPDHAAAVRNGSAPRLSTARRAHQLVPATRTAA